MIGLEGKLVQDFRIGEFQLAIEVVERLSLVQGAEHGSAAAE